MENPEINEDYVDFRSKTALKNWKTLWWPIFIFYWFVIFIEGGINRFETTENFISGVGGLLIGILFNLLYFLQKHHLISTRIAGPFMWIATVAWMSEVVVQNGEYKVYEGYLTMIAWFFLYTIHVVVDVWIMPFIMLLSHSFALYRFHSCLSYVPTISIPCFLVPIFPFLLWWYKCNLSIKNEYMYMKAKESTIKKLHLLLKAFPERIIVSKSDKHGRNKISFTNDSELQDLFIKGNNFTKERIFKM